MNVKFNIPPKATPLFKEHRVLKVMYGGRVSAKSHTAANYVLARCVKKKSRWICAREIQRSISDSVHALLKQQIEKLNYDKLSEPSCYVTDTSIEFSNGSQITYIGLRMNVENLKSIPNIDGVWVEEAAKVSKHSWTVLIPTISRTVGSEILVTFNPEDETDPTSQMFINRDSKDFRSDAMIVEMNWQDNPWFDEQSRLEMARDYARDPELADHIWAGKFLKVTDAMIFAGRWTIAERDTKHGWYGPYFGQDHGFSLDPEVLVCTWVKHDGTELYVSHEAYGSRVELPDLNDFMRRVPGSIYDPSPEMLKRRPGATPHMIQQPEIWADSARPEVNSYLRGQFGFNIKDVVKYPGCVVDRISWLRQFKIVFHPDCVGCVKEARLYRFKIDPLTGRPTREIIDRDNHGWDAIGYSMDPVMAGKNKETAAGVVMLGQPSYDQVAQSMSLDEFEQQEMMSW